MNTRIYQICYSTETLGNVPEGFLTLDNLANERPDWREYWPIRQFLLSNQLSDNTLYGFFSPKFCEKTSLTNEKINQFIAKNYTGQSAVSFSPFWDLMGIFKNIFEQGDFFHPGLLETSQSFSTHHLAGINLIDSITHSQNTIFCNYFLATKDFWLQWLNLGELLFRTAEINNNSLGEKLNATTNYGAQQLPMKVFVQERLATMFLLANKNFDLLAYSPFEMGPSTTPFNQFFHESVINDALKIAYTETGHVSYLNEFSSIREKIISKLHADRIF